MFRKNLNLFVMSNIAVLASGNGSNAQALIDHFSGKSGAQVALIVTDNPKAHVIERAHAAKIPCLTIRNSDLTKPEIIAFLQALDVELIVLAGYLSLVPEPFIHAFGGNVINLHPALLPKYGGKGMYGIHVHESVIANHDSISGITIHWVNSKYDEGRQIFQATCPVLKGDTPEVLAHRIHALEHKHLPEVVEKLMVTAERMD